MLSFEKVDNRLKLLFKVLADVWVLFGQTFRYYYIMIKGFRCMFGYYPMVQRLVSKCSWWSPKQKLALRSRAYVQVVSLAYTVREWV